MAASVPGMKHGSRTIETADGSVVMFEAGSIWRVKEDALSREATQVEVALALEVDRLQKQVASLDGDCDCADEVSEAEERADWAERQQREAQRALAKIRTACESLAAQVSQVIGTSQRTI